MQNIGAFLDKIFYFAAGIYLIVLSYKNKEKLGDKVMLTRVGGILLIIVGIMFTIRFFFE